MEKKIQPNAAGVEAECVSTAALCAGLPCAVPASTILGWGFTPHAKIKAGMWWALSEVPLILRRLEDEIAGARMAL